MLTWLIYLWTRIDVVIGFLRVCLVFSGLISVVSGVVFSAIVYDQWVPEETKDFCKRIFKKATKILITTAILFCIIPCQKDIPMMYVLPKMANSETMQILEKETPELAKMAIKALKEKLVIEKEKTK